jgi:hypothetical protein
MKRYVYLVALLLFPAALLAQQVAPAPDISIAANGGSPNLYSGWPLIVHLTIMNSNNGNPNGNSDPLVVSFPTGVWTDAISLTVLSSSGTAVQWPLKLVGTPSDAVLTLATAEYVQASWQMSSADVSAINPGDYTVTAKIQVSNSTGWNGLLQSVPLSITVGPEPTLTPDQQAEKTFQASEFAVNSDDLVTAITATQQLRTAQPDNPGAAAIAANVLNLAGYSALAFLESSDALDTFYRLNPAPVEAPFNFLPTYQQLLTDMATPDNSVLPTSTLESAATLTFSPNAQLLSLAATVTSSTDVEGGTVSFTISGIAGSAISQPVTAGDASASFTLPGGTPAGSYPIQASYHGTSSFTASSDASATLIISKAQPTITWINPADITQGTALGPNQLNATANVPGAFKYTPASGTVLLVGPAQLLSVNFTPIDATDYNATSSSAKINVTAFALPPLTITSKNATLQYGQTTPSLNNVTYTGFATGDTPASLTGTLTCISSAKSSSPVATYPITCSGLSSTKYKITFVPGTLSVTKAPLTVTAVSTSRAFGQPNPLLTALFSTFANGDNLASLAGSLTCFTSAKPTSSVAGSPFPITCSGVTSPNYAITFIPGSLTITKATPTITWSNPLDLGLGSPLGPAQLNPSANVPGAFVYTPPAGTILPAGNAQTLSAAFTPTDTADYNSTNASVIINVKAIPGDLNGDGVVNCADLAIIKASFGKKTGQPGFDPRADVNGDGSVNVIDLAFVSRQLPAGTACK